MDYDEFRIRGISEGDGPASHLDKTAEGAKGEFKSMLTGLIKDVDSLQKNADESIKGLVEGKSESVHDIMLQMEDAEVAFDLMMEIRNKLVDAYQQILKMQP